jgi:hypothetical protein
VVAVYPGFCQEGLGKTTKELVKIVVKQAENLSRHLPNSSPNYYLLTGPDTLNELIMVLVLVVDNY